MSDWLNYIDCVYTVKNNVKKHENSLWFSNMQSFYASCYHKFFYIDNPQFKNYEFEEKTKNQSSWELTYVSSCSKTTNRVKTLEAFVDR